MSQPSPAEVREHSLTHFPYKAWCCVAFRARSDRHAQLKDSSRTRSVLSIDFAFTNRDPAEAKLCCLVAHDEHTKWVQAWPVPAKGGAKARNYMATELTRLLSYLGHRQITIRADPEPLCSALADAVRSLRNRVGVQTFLEQTPKEEHQANFAEGAIERIRQHVGTLLAELEEKLDLKIKTFDPLRC